MRKKRASREDVKITSPSLSRWVFLPAVLDYITSNLARDKDRRSSRLDENRQRFDRTVSRNHVETNDAAETKEITHSVVASFPSLFRATRWSARERNNSFCSSLVMRRGTRRNEWRTNVERNGERKGERGRDTGCSRSRHLARRKRKRLASARTAALYTRSSVGTLRL